MSTVSSIASLTLDLPPSCITFCSSRPELFVVGTYFLHPRGAHEDVTRSEDTLDEYAVESDNTSGPQGSSPSDKEQKRTGSLILFRLDRDDKIILVHTEATDFAILDIQWSPHFELHGDLLAVATSTGAIAFYRLHASESSQSAQQLVLACVKQISAPTTLVLSLAWHPLQTHVIGVTLSDGRVYLCENTGSELWDQDAEVRMSGIHKHELEAWTLAFDPMSTSVLSGGDDIVLQKSQIHDPQNPMRAWQDRKIHEAGVTAILPISQTLVVTGSYDDHIRLLFTPVTGRRQTLASLDLGGGVWRLRILEGAVTEATSIDSALSANTSILLLASCMHAGTRIVRLMHARDSSWNFEVLAKFEEHRSMNYGTDVQPGRSGEPKAIVSTSFYDKLLCLWRFDCSCSERASI